MARPRRTSVTSDSSVPDSNQELGSMYDYLAKVILLGPSGAGKSCLLHRFLKNEFRLLSSQTIGVEFASKIIKIGTGTRRKRIKLQLWDTAGTERFRSVSRSYYRGAAGAILVYDIASLASFEALPTFLMDARALASPRLTLLLAGNKQDLVFEASASASASSVPRANEATGAGGLLWSASSGDGFGNTSSVSSRQSIFSSDAARGQPLRRPPSAGFSSSSAAAAAAATATATTATGAKQPATIAPEGRQVSTETASRWASRSNIPVAVEVSALSGENVDELFSRLARMILTKIELGDIDPDDPQSGIQYGDVAAWAGAGGDIGSIKSVEEDGSLRSRRGGGSIIKNKKNRGVRLGTGTWFGSSGMREWEDVFGISGWNTTRRRRRSSSSGGACC